MLVFRSTVEFAREVSTIKASEDALKGIESMSGVASNDLITSRVGSNAGSYKNPSPKNVKVKTSTFVRANCY